MSAMDKMIAQMLGVNPQELAEMASNAQSAILAVQEQANRIEQMQALMNDKLDAILERLPTEGKSDADGRPKRSRGSGGVGPIGKRGANGGDSDASGSGAE
jgi:uncharacterized membrane protein YdfJ with MMPL/SSD domain